MIDSLFILRASKSIIMKNLLSSAMILSVTCSILSCSGVRPASNSSVPAGSAANISPGGNTTAVPVANNAVVSGKEKEYTNAERIGAAAKYDNPAQFIKDAALSSMLEAQLSELALKQSRNAYVKAYASMILEDQGKATADLHTLADSKNIGLDSVAYSKSLNIGQKMTQLTASTGPDFDKLYVETMAKNHKQAIRLYAAGTESNDAEIKAYAKKYIPSIVIHMKNVSALNSKGRKE